MLASVDHLLVDALTAAADLVGGGCAIATAGKDLPWRCFLGVARS